MTSIPRSLSQGLLDQQFAPHGAEGGMSQRLRAALAGVAPLEADGGGANEGTLHPSVGREEDVPSRSRDTVPRARSYAGESSMRTNLQAAVPARTPRSELDAVSLRNQTERTAAAFGFSADQLHEALKELGFDANDLTEALRQFQEAAGLPITGGLDPESLLAILAVMLQRDRRPAPGPSSGGSNPHARPSSTAMGGTGGGNPSGAEAASEAGRAPPRTSPVDAKNWKAGAGDVTPEQLQKIVPGLASQKANEVAPHLNRAMAEAGIDSPERKAAFIAQLAHESGGFKYMEEIASGAAYEGRSDLGNTQPGDGTRFKGRGFIQVTGRANYAAASKALGEDFVRHPERAGTPENAARIAAWYWNSRGLNSLADKGDFDGITRRINGGTNGKADRDRYHARAVEALKDSHGLPSTGQFVEGTGTAGKGATGVGGNVQVLAQKDGTSCGLTSVAMMANAWNKTLGTGKAPITDATLRAEQPGGANLRGALTKHLPAGVKWKDRDFNKGQRDFSEIDAQLAKGNPVMMGLGAPFTASGYGHIFVVTGKTPDGQYIIADPNGGKTKTVPLSTLKNAGNHSEGSFYMIADRA